MNAIVANGYNSLGNWFHRFTTNMGRQFNKIGYLRAATELDRMGYHEQAKRCRVAAEAL